MGGQNFGFGLHRTQVAQRGGFAVSVVEDFDVFEDVGPQLGLIGKDVIAHCGGFVTAIKRFHRRVVIAVALTAHAGVHFQPPQQSLVAVTGVGAASVTVVHDTFSHFAASQGCVFQGGAYQLGVITIRYTPTDDAPGAQIHDRRQVIPT